MVFNVRCYKCGEHSVRLILGGREVIHARCHHCKTNLLSEVLEFEQEVKNVGHEILIRERQNTPNTYVQAYVAASKPVEKQKVL